jgi:hypothetical protein
LDSIHRKTTEEEFYFIRNKTKDPQTLTCRFRGAAKTKGLVPELWWPDAGLRSACHDWKGLATGETEVPVALGPSGSVFVVFRKAGAALDPIARDTFSTGIRCGPSQPALRAATSIGFKLIRRRIVRTAGFPAARHGPFTIRFRRS